MQFKIANCTNSPCQTYIYEYKRTLDLFFSKPKANANNYEEEKKRKKKNCIKWREFLKGLVCERALILAIFSIASFE